ESQAFETQAVEGHRGPGRGVVAVVFTATTDPGWGPPHPGRRRSGGASDQTQPIRGGPAMRLNQLHPTVPYRRRAPEFFETYFGFRCVAERGRGALAVLADESGFILSLNNFDKVAKVEYPGAFHIGFMQENRERVDEIYQRLTSGGFDPEPPREFHGAW